MCADVQKREDTMKKILDTFSSCGGALVHFYYNSFYIKMCEADVNKF